MRTIEQRLRQILREVVGGIPEDHEIDLNQNAVIALVLDSLDTVELMMAVEDEFRVEIDDAIADEFRTLQQVIDYLHGEGVSDDNAFSYLAARRADSVPYTVKPQPTFLHKVVVFDNPLVASGKGAEVFDDSIVADEFAGRLNSRGIYARVFDLVAR